MEKISVVASSYRARPPAFPFTHHACGLPVDLIFSTLRTDLELYPAHDSRRTWDAIVYWCTTENTSSSSKCESSYAETTSCIDEVAETVIRCRNRDEVCSNRCKRLCNQDDWKEEIDTARYKNM